MWKKINQKIDRWIIFPLVTVGFILGVYASFIEPFMLRITHYDFQTEKWPYERPLTVALLSDIHMVWPWMTPSHLQDIVDRTNELNPDIVLLLGDYMMTGLPSKFDVNPTEGVAPLKNLTPKCGIYAILGNHDFHTEASQWPIALKETGIPVFENDARSLNCEGQELWIAGLDEFWHGQPDIHGTMDKMMDDNPIIMPVIMMVHNPDLFVDIPPEVMLTVAGHNHAGQVRFPFIGSVEGVIPSQYGKRFEHGHIIEDGKDLIVSAGLGMSGLPIRFLALPEITLITVSRFE